MQSSPPTPEASPPFTSRVPSHLYKRGGLYYFRVVIPDTLRQRIDLSELRISLRTAYRRTALEMARRLYVYFHELLESDLVLTHAEIRKRLNIYLQRQLEDDHDNILGRPSIKDYFVLGAESATDYSETDMYRYYAEKIQEIIKSPEDLKITAKVVCEELIRCGIFLLAEITKKNRLAIVKAYLATQVTFYRLLEKRCSGDYLAEHDIVLADFGPLPKQPNAKEDFEKFLREEELELAKKKAKEEAATDSITQQAPYQLKPSMLYSNAVKVFVKNKIDEEQWKPHMVAEHEGQLKFFLDIMGDMTLNQISRDLIRKYRSILSQLPPNYTKKAEYKGKTIQEILEMKSEEVLSTTRVNMLVQAVSSLLDWFVNEGVLSSNLASGLQKKEDRQVIDLRHPFENKDLIEIFSHPKFAEGRLKFADYFWPPLASLFSGMRLEEICQLHCKDIYEVGGIWVIDINAKGTDEKGYGKTLKNPSATRLVPIHKTLIDLGFVRYVGHISASGSIRLFPNLNKSDRVGKFGKQVGKQFNDLVKAALKAPDYNSEGKVFHSLRHNFADFYKQRGLQNDVFRQLYGHEIPELAASQYGSKFPPDRLNEVISALDYGLDLSWLKKSKFIRELP